MRAAGFIFTIFVHTANAIFSGESVENYEKISNSATLSVDKCVDDVDRSVNIHQKAENIYTSAFYAGKNLPALQQRHNCKTGGLFSAREPHFAW